MISESQNIEWKQSMNCEVRIVKSEIFQTSLFKRLSMRYE